MLLTTIGWGGGGGGGGTRSMTIFLELLNIIHDFLNKIFEPFWSHHHIFPYYHNFIIHHY
jgi:hypothetical protein